MSMSKKDRNKDMIWQLIILVVFLTLAILNNPTIYYWTGAVFCWGISFIGIIAIFSQVRKSRKNKKNE